MQESLLASFTVAAPVDELEQQLTPIGRSGESTSFFRFEGDGKKGNLISVFVEYEPST